MTVVILASAYFCFYLQACSANRRQAENDRSLFPTRLRRSQDFWPPPGRPLRTPPPPYIHRPPTPMPVTVLPPGSVLQHDGPVYFQPLIIPPGTNVPTPGPPFVPGPAAQPADQPVTAASSIPMTSMFAPGQPYPNMATPQPYPMASFNLPPQQPYQHANLNRASTQLHRSASFHAPPPQTYARFVPAGPCRRHSTKVHRGRSHPYKRKETGLPPRPLSWRRRMGRVFSVSPGSVHTVASSARSQSSSRPQSVASEHSPRPGYSTPQRRVSFQSETQVRLERFPANHSRPRTPSPLSIESSESPSPAAATVNSDDYVYPGSSAQGAIGSEVSLDGALVQNIS